MATLTRRRDANRQTEHWLIFAEDIIGSMGVRGGVPIHAEQWQWTVSVFQHRAEAFATRV
jgi:hypothetical protein